MKHSEEDVFKKFVNNKINDKPLPSSEDEELWKKILQGINREPRQENKFDIQWYASAAAILLFITVAFGIFYYKYTQQSEHLLALTSENIKPAVIHNVSNKQADTLSDIKENISTELVAKKPSFTSAKAFKACDKIIKQHLSDGSLITLNKGALVKVESVFTNQRNVLLEDGEAYFEVKPDSQKVFTVYFGDVKLTVLGTKFNIRNHRKEKLKEVTVTEGRVMVWVEGKEEGIELKKGDQLKLTGKNKTSKRRVDAVNYIRWKTGNLNFKNIKLEELVTIFSRQFSAEITLAKNLENCRYTGDFTGLSLDESLKVISLSTSIKVNKSGNNKVELTGENCE